MHKRWVMLALALLPSPHAEAQGPRASEKSHGGRGTRSASSAAPDLRLVVEYDAPRGCPSRRQFERRVADRLSASGSAPRRATRVRVQLWTGTGSARGTVTIEAGASRSLEGASCREVAEGLALITALALTQEPGGAGEGAAADGARRATGQERDRGSAPAGSARGEVDAAASVGEQVPDTGVRAGSASSGAEQAGAARGGAESARKAADAAAQSGDTRAAGASTGEASDQNPSGQVRAGSATGRAAPERPAVPAAAPSGEAESDAADGGDDDAAEPEPGSPSHSSLRLGASLLAFHGIAPRLRPGLQLTAALVHPLPGLELSVQLAGRLALPQTLDSSAGQAHFGFVGGALALCAAPSLGRSGLALRACGVAEPGALLWSGTQTEEARAYTRPWLALGPAAGLWWRGTWLGLGLGAELLWPVRRDRALLAGEVLTRVPAACLHLQIGLELSFDARP